MSETDLVHHYKVLKQFLDISDDSNARSKSNSSRAVRAREKLFKLSAAQFKELSTDVHDELKRRIDESRGEPDYLLPKSSFHPKRNQARQKLSSLPQSRFKDLVSDISYEIERRGLHTEKHQSLSSVNSNAAGSSHSRSGSQSQKQYQQQQQQYQEKQNHHSHSHSLSGSSTHGYHLEEASKVPPQYRIDEADEDYNDSKIQQHNLTKESIASESQNQTIGIQSTTVVPNKANLTWSSDEEDERSTPRALNGAGDGFGAKNDSISNYVQQITDKDALIDDLRIKLTTAQDDRDAVASKYRLLQDDYDYSVSQNKTLAQELEVLAEEKREWSTREIPQDNTLELENLRTVNSSLRSEVQNLKASAISRAEAEQAARAKTELSRNVRTSTDSNSSLNSKKDTIKKDMEAFIDKLSNLDSNSRAPNTNSYADLKREVTKWQKKFEEARSNKLSADLTKSIMSREEMNSFVSPYGLVSIKLVADLQALVESFVSYLNGDTFDSDILFEKISKISILANEIAAQGDKQHLNSNEHSIGLREAVSYSLTATRYFAVYSSILPKVIVERSIGEICFSLCDLITVSKLNENSTNSRNVVASEKVRAEKSVGKQINGNNAAKADDFGVRPLRIANRLRETQQAQEDREDGDESKPADFSSRSRDVSGASVVQVVKPENAAETDSNPSQKPQSVTSTASSFLKKFSPFGISAAAAKTPSTTDSTSTKNGQAAGDDQIPITASPVQSPTLPKAPKGILKSSSNSSLNETYPDRQSSLTKLNIQKIPASDERRESEESLPEVNKSTQIPKQRTLSSETSTTTTINNGADSTSGTTGTSATSPRRNESPRSKNFDALASKFEQGTKEPFVNTSSPKSKGVSAGLLQLTNKLNNSSDKLSKSTPAYVSPPRNANILDKMKQFENTDDDAAARGSPGRGSPGQHSYHSRKSSLADGLTSSANSSVIYNESPKKSPKVKQLSGPFEAISSIHSEQAKDVNTINGGADVNGKSISGVDDESASKTGINEFGGAAAVSAVVGAASIGAASVLSDKSQNAPSIQVDKAETGTKNKGLFQSIRDRLTSETDPKDETSKSEVDQLRNIQPDDTTISSEGTSDNDKVEVSIDKVLTSTAETTPSKEIIGDDQGDYTSAQTEKGFFKAIRDRLTTATDESGSNGDETEYKKPLSSAASDSTIDLTRDNAKNIKTHQRRNGGYSDDSEESESEEDDDDEPPRRNSERMETSKQAFQTPESPLSRKTVASSAAPANVRKVSNSSVSSGDSYDEPTQRSPYKPQALNPQVQSREVAQKPAQKPAGKSVTYANPETETESEEESEEDSEEGSEYESETDEEEVQARQRQEYRKSVAAATFNVDLFDIDDPDNTLTQVLLYLEHQTVQVISTIQSLLSAIKKPDATRGDLRVNSQAITVVIGQMTEATNTSMNQTRNAQLKEHGSWVVRSLEDCQHRMNILCRPNSDKSDDEFADKNFKQRLAGISFDIAKCTKELVKSVEEASLKEDIANLDARLAHGVDLT